MKPPGFITRKQLTEENERRALAKIAAEAAEAAEATATKTETKDIETKNKSKE